VLLPDMDAVRSADHRVVDPIVEDAATLVLAAEGDDLPSPSHRLGGANAFHPQLHPADAASKQLVGLFPHRQRRPYAGRADAVELARGGRVSHIEVIARFQRALTASVAPNKALTLEFLRG